MIYNFFLLFHDYPYWIIKQKKNLFSLLIFKKNNFFLIIPKKVFFLNQNYLNFFSLTIYNNWLNICQWQYISLYSWLNIKLHFRQKAMWLRVRRNRIRSIMVNINIALHVNMLAKDVYLYKKKTFINI